MHPCVQTSVDQAPTQWAKTARLAPLIGLLLLVSAVPMRAATLTFTAVLTSGQEPPPTRDSGERAMVKCLEKGSRGSTATGVARMEKGV
jgi:hypothetical protein